MTTLETENETPDTWGAFPRLSGAQIAELEAYGRRRPTGPGEVLIREGDQKRDLMVILAGVVEVVEGYGTPEQKVIRVHGPGRFLDELGLLSGQPSFVTWVVREPGEVLVVPIEGLRQVVALDPRLGDLILRAFIIRRELLIDERAGLKIIGSRFSPDSRRLREFAARNRLPHRWIDLEEDSGAEELLRRLGVSPEETPVVVWNGAEVLRNPGSAELARLTGFDPPPAAPDAVRDLVVIGAGPAGLAAAVYGASEGLSTMVLDAVATGGQAGTSSRIENYPGFPTGISGAELADRSVIQAEKFGAGFSVPVEATDLERRAGYTAVVVGDGPAICARTVVVATGARYRRLDVPRLDEFEGKSIYYAATLVEAQFCVSRPVVVVGGGNSAGQACVYLSQIASKVYLVIRGDDLNKDMSRYLVDQIERNRRIEVLRNTEVRELVGYAGELQAVLTRNNRTGEYGRLDTSALFVFIGVQPCTGWLAGRLPLDEKGFILTGPQSAEAAREGAGSVEPAGAHPPNLLETSWPGVLAVGDVRAGSIKRVTSAMGEGAMAVRLIHEHLARVH
jgi:thioredoxin reductase (NADPH)